MEHLINPNPVRNENMGDQQDEPVDVIFRRWPKREGGGVLALFPGIQAQRYMCSSYEHVGQHGAASFDVMDRTKPARTDEPDVQDLIKELHGIGYNHLVVMRRVQRRHREACR